jgi:hypothetical protein
VRTLAEELRCLALALEQAGAYIAQRAQSFAQYFAEWQGQRDEVLAWFDPRLMQYPKSVAITWQTSFDQVGEAARRLLRRVAWLATDPSPESLLEVLLPIAAGEETDPFKALAELDSYSLVKRAANTSSFTVHRLVQEVTRRGQSDRWPPAALIEGLAWVNAAFVGDPQDVRNWRVLEQLVPHARAVAGYADRVGITDPTAGLLSDSGTFLLEKAVHGDAEPLMRRALAIDEASFGVEHPTTAVRFNTLAHLLQATNRLAEAEPLMRRALRCCIASVGIEHPNTQTILGNYGELPRAMAKTEDEIRDSVLPLLQQR